MNDVFFGCVTCRVLVDAGYRWATSTLESSGVVERQASVDAAAVRAASEYWSPPEEPASRWLIDDVLPRVRTFLDLHATHDLRFGDFEELAGTNDTAFLDWLDLSMDPEFSPRLFVEVLGFTLWVDVIDWVRSREYPPWWWNDSELVDAARRRFGELAASAHG